MGSSGRKRVWLRAMIALVTIAVLLLGSLEGFLIYQRWSFATNIQKLQVGDTKERVEDLLGSPRLRIPKGSRLLDEARKVNFVAWLLVPESPETWVYGPWRWVRINEPAKDDYAIEFDDAGRVSRVVFPDDPKW